MIFHPAEHGAGASGVKEDMMSKMKTAEHLPEVDHQTVWCEMPANGQGIPEFQPELLLVIPCAVSLGEGKPFPARPPFPVH